MNKELFDKEKKLLLIHHEIKDIHAHLLDQHFTSIDLNKSDEYLSMLTAFPTPNDYYKEHIYSLIKVKKDSELIGP